MEERDSVKQKLESLTNEQKEKIRKDINEGFLNFFRKAQKNNDFIIHFRCFD